MNQLVGKFAEYQLATDMRTRKKFPLAIYFSGVKDKKPLNIIDIRLRLLFQRPDAKNMEIDIHAESDDNRVVLIEVKKWTKKIGVEVIRDFWEKVNAYKGCYPNKKVYPCILSVGGFSVQAKKMCEDLGIGMAETIAYMKED